MRNGQPIIESAPANGNIILELKDPGNEAFAWFDHDPEFVLNNNCTGYFNGGCFTSQINAITGIFNSISGGIAYFDKIVSLTGSIINTTVNNVTINTQTITGTTLYISSINGENLWINNCTGTNLFITENINSDIIKANSSYLSSITGTNVYISSITGSYAYFTTLDYKYSNFGTLSGTSNYFNTITGTNISETYAKFGTMTGSSNYFNTITGTNLYINYENVGMITGNSGYFTSLSGPNIISDYTNVGTLKGTYGCFTTLTGTNISAINGNYGTIISTNSYFTNINSGNSTIKSGEFTNLSSGRLTVIGNTQVGGNLILGGNLVSCSNITQSDAINAITNWTSYTGASSGNWKSIAVSNEIGLFVAVGNGCCEYSYDGISWYLVSIPVSIQWNSIVWSPQNAIFVATGGNNSSSQYSAVSSNGISWTTNTIVSGIGYYPRDVCWIPELNKFILALENGYCAHSLDGINWSVYNTNNKVGGTMVWSPTLKILSSICHSLNYASISYDGINWTTYSIVGTLSLITECWCPEIGLFIAGGSGSFNTLSTSTDGINWTLRNSGLGNAIITKVSWSSDLHMGIAQSGYSGASYSYDGINWIPFTEPQNNNYNGIVWSKYHCMFCGVASNSSTVITSKYVKNLIYNTYVVTYICLKTLGGVMTKLYYYEEITNYTLTFGTYYWNPAVQTTCHLTRIGNTVTMLLNGSSGTQNNSTSYIQSTEMLPQLYRPNSTFETFILTSVDNLSISHIGLLNVNTSGHISIYLNYDKVTNWPANKINNFFTTTVSWVIA